ncbi:hypothetical protein MPL1032_80164 [Mesorhizobium plurifarium]|uniref:Uncharacterized protein n=1 Tax=Mesorhizobium plurifarium TaxID=69974 RepID=A0A0K2W7N8_MESPL|nr:hypothetical protein MPL1032_80164 [Mesorhizobium plurifarium]
MVPLLVPARLTAIVEVPGTVSAVALPVSAMVCAPVVAKVGVQVVAVTSLAGTVVVVTGSTLSCTPPVVSTWTLPADPPALCELSDCRLLLTVMVPLELTVSVQVAVMEPLKRTFPVVADAVWQAVPTTRLAAIAARANFIETPLSSRMVPAQRRSIISLSWLI